MILAADLIADLYPAGCDHARAIVSMSRLTRISIKPNSQRERWRRCYCCSKVEWRSSKLVGSMTFALPIAGRSGPAHRKAHAIEFIIPARVPALAELTWRRSRAGRTTPPVPSRVALSSSLITTRGLGTTTRAPIVQIEHYGRRLRAVCHIMGMTFNTSLFFSSNTHDQRPSADPANAFFCRISPATDRP